MGVSGAEITAGDVVELFNQRFAIIEATVLVGGAAEPFFVPGQPSQIHFREDYVRSALHEVAHWCVAGKRRRELPDYGYWYAPDGRTAAQQAAFFAVEARPQAVEWVFCDACGLGFTPSVDNIKGDPTDADIQVFFERIAHWRSRLLELGLPERAVLFHQSLSEGVVSTDSQSEARKA